MSFENFLLKMMKNLSKNECEAKPNEKRSEVEAEFVGWLVCFLAGWLFWLASWLAN